jgi:5-methyltetrahydrofolate--homocysteine methyltransferase
VHVGREMEREGFRVPLLIGGATTSPLHTALKIAPAYSHPVVHVADASRAVRVVGSLMSADRAGAFAGENLRAQERAREQYQNRREKPLLSISEARRRRTPIPWRPEDLATPSFLGVRSVENLPLADLLPLIDWSPFFHAWELRGRYPEILKEEKYGAKARELFEDAERLLSEIVANRLLSARGVYGFFPANSVEDDIEIYADSSRLKVAGVLHTLRQQNERPEGEPNQALADFIAPKSTGLPDFLGMFAVTTGFGAAELCDRFERDHDDYNSIMTKALADRLAEAFAEWLHRQARRDWGYGHSENLTAGELIRERYRGIRPAPGYPACPDHSEKRLIFDLLEAERRAGIRLTENFAMFPPSSVSGCYFAHPKARYFAVGRIGRDQVLDYRLRKGADLAALERWLSPNLAASVE